MPKKILSKKPANKKKTHVKAKKLKRIAKKVTKKAKKPQKVKAKKHRPAKVRKAVKKPAKAKAAKKISVTKKKVAAIVEKVIGKVTHYYDRIGVAVVALESPIRVGDTVRLKHGDAAFEQKVESLQVNHAPIAVAKAGEEVGMKVDQLATEGTLLIKP